MKTLIDTTRFENSYGKKPSGFGCWAFETKDKETVMQFFGTFTDAKKAAKESDFVRLFVCS